MLQSAVADFIAVESSMRGMLLLPVWNRCCERTLFCRLGHKILHTVSACHMFSPLLSQKGHFFSYQSNLFNWFIFSSCTIWHVKFFWSEQLCSPIPSYH